jgi:serine/threonine protein kinase
VETHTHTMEDYTVIKKLGTGGQGATYSCIRKHDNNSFVIKQVCVIPVPALRTVT